MKRTTTRSLIAVATGLVALSLGACASSPEKAAEKAAQKQARKEAGPAALGYTIMNNNGEPLYCKQIRPTGSNVARTTKCMTAKDWQDSHNNDQRTLEELRRGYDVPK